MNKTICFFLRKQTYKRKHKPICYLALNSNIVKHYVLMLMLKGWLSTARCKWEKCTKRKKGSHTKHLPTSLCHIMF